MSFREQGNIRMNQNEPWNRSETQSDKDSNHYERDDLGLSFKNRNAKSYRNPDPRKKFHGLFRNTNYSSNEASEFEDVYRDIELKAPLTERKRSDKQEIKIRDDETNTDKNDDILRILTAKRRMEPAGLSQRLIKIFGVVEQPEKPHSLKVAVIGEPNAGKSTLINTMIGQEISVVSPKAHTTRERVLAVFTQDNYQVVFLDTPGIVEDNKSSKLDKTLLTSAWRALDEADHLIILVDSKKALLPGSQPIEENILSHLSKYSTPTTLVFNKMDLLDNQVELLQATAERYKAGYKHIQQTLFVSALQQNTLNDVKETLFKSSTPRLWAYPKEAKYEMSDLKRVEELIRVEFFKRLYDYIPYMLKQENTGWTEERNGKLRIEQTVYVERDSQQKIVVGAKGAVVDKVVEAARAKVSEALGREVQLFIQVRTKKK
ncbi:P-loop containing nucleoside triphosphate hydrolase protein [Spinellus fusiger]|nr:P-loop containing nucleoside triphosphate hydrolase protein [Spinellus fusiger]